MAGMISKQPNGLYCRYSTVSDGLTHYNMTRQEYIDYCIERVIVEANDMLDNYLHSFDEIKESLSIYETKEGFDELIKIMETKK